MPRDKLIDSDWEDIDEYSSIMSRHKLIDRYGGYIDEYYSSIKRRSNKLIDSDWGDIDEYSSIMRSNKLIDSSYGGYMDEYSSIMRRNILINRYLDESFTSSSSEEEDTEKKDMVHSELLKDMGFDYSGKKSNGSPSPRHKLIDESLSSSEEEKDTKKKGIVHSEPLKPIDFDYSRKKSDSSPSGTSCLICMDVFPTLDLHVLSKKRCNHPVCEDCLLNCVMQKFRESDFGEELFIKCPKDDCKDMMKPQDLQTVVPEDVLIRWRNEIRLSKILPRNDDIRDMFGAERFGGFWGDKRCDRYRYYERFGGRGVFY